MPHVVHLTTVHSPTDVRIFRKQAITLADHGYDVTLIACAPRSYESRGVRVKALPAHAGRLARMTRTALEAYRSALAEDADLYHFHDPELIPIAVRLKLHGKRVVYDVHEDVSKDIADKRYLPRWLSPLMPFAVGSVERVATRCFDAMVAATPAIARKFPPERTITVRNVPIRDEMHVAGALPFAERPRRVVYVGGLAPFNGVDQMIAAMAALPADSDIRLSLGGRFPAAGDEAALHGRAGMDRVDFLGWVDRERVGALLAEARAGLVIYQPTPNIMECEPNKFYEVLSAGLPLIATDLPHWRRFIETHQCGLVVPPNDPRAVARAIQTLVDDPSRAEAMGRRGRELIEREYNWETESQRLLALYERLLARPAAAGAATTITR